MRPVRRELLNALFVLVLASLIHAAFEGFHLKFDAHLWALIMMGIAIAVSGYVVLEFVLSADERERAWTESTRGREEEWLKRVGTPARLELNMDPADVDLGRVAHGGAVAVVDALEAMSPDSDLTIMIYFGSEGGKEEIVSREGRDKIFSSIEGLLKRGMIREYKRIICFDYDVLASDPESKSGVLRVGEGPGTIPRAMAEHCRLMMANKACSLYVAPVVFRGVIGLYGVNKVAISVETVDQGAGGRRIAGMMLFSDPPNGEIIEQFRQMERATEKQMVAVHEIRFPEDAAPTAVRAAR
jgi:hypothetical protein